MGEDDRFPILRHEKAPQQGLLSEEAEEIGGDRLAPQPSGFALDLKIQ